jgi:hypothetical protein
MVSLIDYVNSTITLTPERKNEAFALAPDAARSETFAAVTRINHEVCGLVQPPAIAAVL